MEDVDFYLALYLQERKERFRSQLPVDESWSKVNAIFVEVKSASVHVNEYTDYAALPKEPVPGRVDLVLGISAVVVLPPLVVELVACL